MDFAKKLDKIIALNNSLLCVGLDPELAKIPPKYKSKSNPLFVFNKSIIDDTVQLVCAFKPNVAFYEAYGLDGLVQLKKTIEYLKKHYSQVPIILDAKRGDVPSTAKMYAKACFEYWNVDAVTVFPHLGFESIQPFLEYKQRLTFLLIRTSGKETITSQKATVSGKPYYLSLAEEVRSWQCQNIGIFVGATFPEELRQVRKIFPKTIFLTAGIGVQGASVKDAVKAGIDEDGQEIIFNASRSIIYNSNPKKAARRLKDEINKYR